MTISEAPIGQREKESEESPRPSRLHQARTFSGRHLNEVGLLCAIAVLYIVFAITATGFMGSSNQLGMLRDAATTGIPAFGVCLVIVAAEIDISIGPAVAFSGVILGKALSQWGMALPVGLFVTLLLGTALGTLAGWLRAQFNVPSFIATLGLYSALRGLAEYMSNGLPVSLPTNSFFNFLSGSFIGIPTPAVFMIVLFGLFAFIARKTAYGRGVFAIGGNANAARLSGIPVKRIRIMLFATTGLLAAITGILLAARLASGNGNSATGLEFNVIAAVVIGGTALSGGRGSMIGTFLGVAFITTIGDGLVLLGVNSFFQEVVQGVIIVVAVLFNIAFSTGTRSPKGPGQARRSSRLSIGRSS